MSTARRVRRIAVRDGASRNPSKAKEDSRAHLASPRIAARERAGSLRRPRGGKKGGVRMGDRTHPPSHPDRGTTGATLGGLSQEAGGRVTRTKGCGAHFAPATNIGRFHAVDLRSGRCLAEHGDHVRLSRGGDRSRGIEMASDRLATGLAPDVHLTGTSSMASHSQGIP